MISNGNNRLGVLPSPINQRKSSDYILRHGGDSQIENKNFNETGNSFTSLLSVAANAPIIHSLKKYSIQPKFMTKKRKGANLLQSSHKNVKKESFSHDFGGAKTKESQKDITDILFLKTDTQKGQPHTPLGLENIKIQQYSILKEEDERAEEDISRRRPKLKSENNIQDKSDKKRSAQRKNSKLFRRYKTMDKRRVGQSVKVERKNSARSVRSILKTPTYGGKKHSMRSRSNSKNSKNSKRVKFYKKKSIYSYHPSSRIKRSGKKKGTRAQKA